MGWQDDQKIMQTLKAIASSQSKVEDIVKDGRSAITALSESQSTCCTKINEKLNTQQNELEKLQTELGEAKADLAKLVAFFIPPPPKPAAGFTAFID